jgi:hypothetical protein
MASLGSGRLTNSVLLLTWGVAVSIMSFFRHRHHRESRSSGILRHAFWFYAARSSNIIQKSRRFQMSLLRKR